MKRRFIKILLVLVLLAAVLTGLAPTILSMGIARNLALGAIAPSVNGSADIERVELSWGGPQRVFGLELADDSGKVLVDVDATASISLLGALGGLSELDVAVSGRVTSELGEDGSLSIADLFASESGGGTPSGGRGAEKSNEPAAMPVVRIRADDLKIDLEQAGAAMATLEALEGTIELIPGTAIRIDLASATTTDGMRGQLMVQGETGALIDKSGAFTPDGVNVDARIEARNLAADAGGARSVIEDIAIDIQAADLARQVRVDVTGSGSVAGEAASAIDGSLVLHDVIGGAFGIGSITGAFEATSLPTGLIQPLVAPAPIDLASDVGPMLDVRLEATNGVVDVNVIADHLDVKLQGERLDDGALRNVKGHAVWSLAPELLAATASLSTEVPVVLNLTIDHADVPAPDAEGAIAWSELMASFVVMIETPVSVDVEGAAPLTVDRLQFGVGPASNEAERAWFSLHANGAAAEIELAVEREGDTLRLVPLERGTLVLPEGGVAALAGPDIGIDVDTRTTFTVDVAPFDPLRELPLVEIGTDRVGIIGIEDDVTWSVRDFALAADFAQPDTLVQVVGGGAIGRGDTAAGPLEFDLALERAAGDELAPRGTAVLGALPISLVESVASLEAGAIAGWTGASGSVEIAIDPGAAGGHATIDYPRARGTLVAERDGETITLTSDDLALDLEPAQLAAFLPKDERGEAALEVMAAPTVTIDALNFTLPPAEGDADPLLASSFAASVGSGTIDLRSRTGESLVLSAARLGLTSGAIGEGVDFTLNGELNGPLRFDGRVDDLLTELPTVTLRESHVAALPTIVIDDVLGLDGKLAAAIGPDVALERATARRFSPQSGSADLRIASTYGFIEGRLNGRPEMLRTDKREPLHGELTLTPSFSREILGFLHPVFRDIRSTEKPVAFSIPSSARWPHDGDLSGLFAEVDLSIGAIELAPGSFLGGVLSAFDQGRETVTGHVDDVHVSIRRGVARYEAFTMQLDRVQLVFAGTVDLVRDEVDLRWSIPIDGLAAAFHELEDYKDLTVPLITRGPTARPVTEIHPDFLAELLRRQLEKEIGGELGGILDRLLRGDDG